MRVTLDTNFLISATQWDNSISHKLLRRMVEKDTDLFTTKEILSEFAEVLARDFEHASDYIESLLSNLLNILKIVEPFSKIEAIKDDPDDNKIIECAISSSSDYILTYDKHLLHLKEYEGVKIIAPDDFLNLFS